MSGRRGNTSSSAASVSSSSVSSFRNNGASSSINGNGSARSNNNAGSSAAAKKQAESFYPKLITAQIIALQCLHYFLLAVCLQINHVFYSSSITIDRLFTADYVRLWKASGWPDVAAILLVDTFAGSFLLAIIVEKSKKCLDFGVTLFIIHLAVCTLYGGFPMVLDWWVVHVLGTILMVLLGEYLCSLRELSDIPMLQL